MSTYRKHSFNHVLSLFVGISLYLVCACEKKESNEKSIVASPFSSSTPQSNPSPTRERNRGVVWQAKNFGELEKEAGKTFGLVLLRSEEKHYRFFRGRLFNNVALASTIKQAERGGVHIGLENSFSVVTGGINVDVKASDAAIESYITKNLSGAQLTRKVFERFQREAKDFGLTLLMSERREYEKIRTRLLSNKNLAVAFRDVSKQGILLGLDHAFSVSGKNATINVDASDEEILTFLLGD